MLRGPERIFAWLLLIFGASVNSSSRASLCSPFRVFLIRLFALQITSCFHGSTLRVSVKVNPPCYTLKLVDTHLLSMFRFSPSIPSLNFMRLVCAFSSMCATLTFCHACNLKKNAFFLTFLTFLTVFQVQIQSYRTAKL
jgi:hypothetical protein